MLKVASLFSGCGGSDLGTLGGFSYLGNDYPRLPFDIVYAVDFDKYAVDTYNSNFTHKAICGDVTAINIEKDIPEIDVLIGGFPCQSFSTVNPTKDTNDARANLYKEIVKVLLSKKPKCFVCENVKGLMTLDGGAILEKIEKEFASTGYKVVHKLLRAVEYGVPQKRERVIIVGIRNDIDVEYEYPKPLLSENEWVPIREVVKELAIPDQKYYFSKRAVDGMKKAKNNMKRGLWQDLDKPCLTLTSHLAKVSLNSRDPVLLVDPEKELYRRFTVAEAAGIQSFPDNFIFPGADNKSYKQIGNAVPPVMMWHVMNSLSGVILGEKFKIDGVIQEVKSNLKSG
jgi:DNA (cytosine-5)-methyltransferase 1